jgi:hypothetical protein
LDARANAKQSPPAAELVGAAVTDSPDSTAGRPMTLLFISEDRYGMAGVNQGLNGLPTPF